MKESKNLIAIFVWRIIKVKLDLHIITFIDFKMSGNSDSLNVIITAQIFLILSSVKPVLRQVWLLECDSFVLSQYDAFLSCTYYMTLGIV